MPKNVIILIVSLSFAIILWGSISLSEIYYATIDANLKLIEFPPGYTTGSDLPGIVSIKVKGQGWKLFSTNIGSNAEFIVSVNSDSGKKLVNLHNNLTYNPWIHSDLEVIEIIPDTVAFLVEKIVFKKVPVVPDLNLSFKPGYGLASGVQYIPDSVTVSGPISKMKDISKIYSNLANFSSLDKKIVRNINLPQSQGLEFSENIIQLTLDVQRIVDKTFEDIPVEVIDVPTDRDVVLLPNKVGCSIRGGIDFLGKLKVNQFRAYVYYNDIVIDTLGSIIPRIELPQNTTLQFIKPERLRYIIKTF
ncbi:MAG TPA: CdaR family protein [Ignavibacteriaceae bacterium]|nr:CdaR family protein [Ignavibacteriaceae bacterium]